MIEYFESIFTFIIFFIEITDVVMFQYRVISDMREILSVRCIKEEIEVVLKEMYLCKFPGSDGMFIFFY